MSFIDIISGKNHGPVAGLIRLALVIPSVFYTGVIGLRNICYNLGILKVHRFDIPIICVGNLTAGGTGKTPMVIWLCKYLQIKGLSVGLLSRGYKGDDEGTNDEMRLLEDSLGSTRFYVGSDRVASAKTAIDDGVMAIVMDDGYQHRRLGRCLDILMVDGLCPFGYGKILPAGLLREPVGGAKRAGIAAISRADIAGESKIEQIKTKLKSINKDMPVITCTHKPENVYSADGVKVPLEELAGKPVTAFCSIGNPAGFVATLEKLGAEVRGRYFFDDHSDYDNERIDILRQLSDDAGEQWLITTEKDWVKLRELPEAATVGRLYWLEIELEITSGQEVLEQVIDKALSQYSIS